MSGARKTQEAKKGMAVVKVMTQIQREKRETKYI